MLPAARSRAPCTSCTWGTCDEAGAGCRTAGSCSGPPARCRAGDDAGRDGTLTSYAWERPWRALRSRRHTDSAEERSGNRRGYTKALEEIAQRRPALVDRRRRRSRTSRCSDRSRRSGRGPAQSSRHSTRSGIASSSASCAQRSRSSSSPVEVRRRHVVLGAELRRVGLVLPALDLDIDPRLAEAALARAERRRAEVRGRRAAPTRAA